MSVSAEVSGCASGYLFFFHSSLLFFIFCAEMQLIRLCIQTFESTQRRRCWLRVFPLLSGLKVETLLQQGLNLEASRHVRAVPPLAAKRFHLAGDSVLEGHDQKVKGSAIIVILPLCIPLPIPRTHPQPHPRCSMTS